jgi:aminopeptidase N
MVFGKVTLRFLLICLLLAGLPSFGEGASLASGTTITAHDLKIELIPDTHELMARDRIELRADGQAKTVTFTLSPTLRVDSIVIPAQAASGQVTQDMQPVTFTSEILSQPATQNITVTLPATHTNSLTLLWTYRGTINDPPREPRHLRFVTPSETSGHIGPEGVYLSSESQWYPDIEGSLSKFRVDATVPVSWNVVTQGQEESAKTENGKIRSEWIIRNSSEALSLVANRFVATSRNWKGPDGKMIQLSTYLLPDNAQLADEYLDATQQYLQVYIPFLGPYPFEKFAVVENFFASGLGMPSFTLLGSGSIKRHYVQPYALGHEIVHSWIGNAVFNRTDRGNWVEGLTTYLANYYWHELVGDRQQARDQRRQIVEGYNLYVTPERDFPVAQFRQKHDERDNAIGYQKAAMVFHHLRGEVGDPIFWQGLKKFIARHRGRHADWSDIERVFADESGQDLRWFFRQWVEQAGAPRLSIAEATARAGSAGQPAFQLEVSIAQVGPLTRVSVPIRIQLDDRHEETVIVPVRSSIERVIVPLPARPREVELDPDYMVFRRIDRDALPPVLNHFVTDSRRTVLTAFSDQPENPSPFRDVLARIEAQERGKPDGERTTIVPLRSEKLLPREGSVLLLSDPEQRGSIQNMIAPHCGTRVSLRDTGFVIDGTSYDSPGMAVLLTCHRTDVPGSVVTLLYATSPTAVARVARLLFFYGWNSVVVFKDGSILSRVEWQSERAVKEVRRESP